MAPTQASESVKHFKKKTHKKRQGDLPVQSFSNVVADLGLHAAVIAVCSGRRSQTNDVLPGNRRRDAHAGGSMRLIKM